MSTRPQGQDVEGTATADDAGQRREWATHRVARIALWAVVGAAFAGVFGGGPLARTSVAAEGCRVEYDRFLRQGTTMRVRCEAAGGSTVVRLSGLAGPLDRVECVPEPAEHRIDGKVRELRFDTQPGAALDLRVRWEPLVAGLHEGTVSIVAGDREVSRVGMWAMAYP